MSNLRINTDLVNSTAETIHSVNTQIRDEFSKPETAVKRLDGTWDGAAAEHSIAKFKELTAKFLDARYAVLENYEIYLRTQIDVGYSNTEENNKALAEAFK